MFKSMLGKLTRKKIVVCLFIFWPKIYGRFKQSFTLTITVKSSCSWLTRILSKKGKKKCQQKVNGSHFILLCIYFTDQRY